MIIRIDRPRVIQGVGKRDHQEDAYSPYIGSLNENSKVFAVCDGMGGHEYGELASGIVAAGLVERYDHYMRQQPNQENFLRLMDSIYNELEDNPHALDGERHMGTTMTFTAITPEGLFLAHLGDSSIFVLRPDKITGFIYRSADHSPVYRLVHNKQLSPIQALSYEGRNMLDKAVMPFNRNEPEIKIVNNVQPGDYVLMCTDGVTEYLTDEMIRFIFAPYRTIEEIVDLLKRHCALSSDNHTALLIPIIGVEETSQITPPVSGSFTRHEPSPSIDDDFMEEAKASSTHVMGVITNPELGSDISGYKRDLADNNHMQEVPSSFFPEPVTSSLSHHSEVKEEEPGDFGTIDYSELRKQNYLSDNLLSQSLQKYRENPADIN